MPEDRSSPHPIVDAFDEMMAAQAALRQAMADGKPFRCEREIVRHLEATMEFAAMIPDDRGALLFKLHKSAAWARATGRPKAASIGDQVETFAKRITDRPIGQSHSVQLAMLAALAAEADERTLLDMLIAALAGLMKFRGQPNFDYIGYGVVTPKPVPRIDWSKRRRRRRSNDDADEG